MQNSLEQAYVNLKLQRQITERRIQQIEDTIKEYGSTWNEQATHRQLRDKLINLEQAQKRVQSGAYGICQMCRCPIDPERLVAVPEATMCIPCTRKFAHRHLDTVQRNRHVRRPH